MIAPHRGPEYWVLKVLTREQVKVLTPAMMSELECVNGEICEPIEWYRAEEFAVRRARRGHQKTGQVHKVTLVI